jgi:hypothetical protein
MTSNSDTSFIDKRLSAKMSPNKTSIHLQYGDIAFENTIPFDKDDIVKDAHFITKQAFKVTIAKSDGTFANYLFKTHVPMLVKGETGKKAAAKMRMVSLGSCIPIAYKEVKISTDLTKIIARSDKAGACLVLENHKAEPFAYDPGDMVFSLHIKAGSMHLNANPDGKPISYIESISARFDNCVKTILDGKRSLNDSEFLTEFEDILGKYMRAKKAALVPQIADIKTLYSAQRRYEFEQLMIRIGYKKPENPNMTEIMEKMQTLKSCARPGYRPGLRGPARNQSR